MKWEKLARDLESGFTVTTLQVPGGRVLVAHEPFNLELALAAIEETEDEERLAEDIGASDVLRDKWPLQPFVSFDWSDVWGMSIELLDIGTPRLYVCLNQEAEGPAWRVIAALEPKDSPEVFSAFFKSLIESNGTAYRVEMFGSLPTSTVNSRPELVPARAVKESYRAWMARAIPSLWVTLEDEVLKGVRDAGHPMELFGAVEELREALGATEKAAATEQMAEYGRKRDAMGARLSEEDRHRILDVYFAMTYREHTTRPGPRAEGGPGVRSDG